MKNTCKKSVRKLKLISKQVIIKCTPFSSPMVCHLRDRVGWKTSLYSVTLGISNAKSSSGSVPDLSSSIVFTSILKDVKLTFLLCFIFISF